MIAELEERLAGETLDLLSFMCSPQHRSTAFHPVIRALERRAGMQPSDSLDGRRRKLSAFVHVYPAAAGDVETLADLLSIPLEHQWATPVTSPQRRRDMTFDFLRRHIESLAARMPVLLVVEDTHWADPTTLEFLETLTDWAENSSNVAILTTRPEYQPSWAGRAGIGSQFITGLRQTGFERSGSRPGRRCSYPGGGGQDHHAIGRRSALHRGVDQSGP